VPKKTGRRPQRDEPPCEIGTAKVGNRQEDVPPCSSGTTQERHLQAEHDPPCDWGAKNTNRPEGVPPCSSGTTQERCLHEGNYVLRELSDPGERNFPSPIVYSVSASNLMMSLNHCGVTVAAKINQQEDHEERRCQQVQTTLQVLLRRHKELLKKDMIKD
jgi:hypothetical protein